MPTTDDTQPISWWDIITTDAPHNHRRTYGRRFWTVLTLTAVTVFTITFSLDVFIHQTPDPFAPQPTTTQGN